MIKQLISNRLQVMLLAIVWLMIGFFACTTVKESQPAPNPFASLNTAVIPKPVVGKLDSASIEGLHYYILQRKCAEPGCHDGTFEPDFRTIQSSYSTLVYQGIIKNDPNRNFEYRVKPGHSADSWLFEKVITNDPIISRMPVNRTPLSLDEIRQIKKWIDNGAKDMFGQTPNQASMAPNLWLVGATVDTFGISTRLDDKREEWAAPFPMLQKAEGIVINRVNLWIGINDQGKVDSTAIEDLKVNELWISEDINDFSKAIKLKAELLPNWTEVKNFWGEGNSGYFRWRAHINPNQLKPNTQYYYRYNVKDNGRTETVQIPQNNTNWYVRTHYSFYVLP
jgi:hypothetical protein